MEILYPVDASIASLPNGADDGSSSLIPPPPPPPLPLPPTTPHIARRASLQDHKLEDRRKTPPGAQKSTGDMLRDIDNVKLRPVARYLVLGDSSASFDFTTR